MVETAAPKKKKTFLSDFHPEVYISYDRRTKSSDVLARKVVDYLTSSGRFTVKIDAKINPDADGDRYDKVTEAIKAADIVILLYTARYQASYDCQREATIAADKAKKLMFIKGQAETFKIEDWFYTLKGGKFDLDYYNEVDPYESLRAYLYDVFNLIVVKIPTGFEIRKFRLVAIQKPSVYYNRENVENLILEELRPVCADPYSGCLLVVGDGGVGKTTIIERILTQKENRPYFLDQCNIRAAVWLNCFEWRDSKQFGVKQQRAVTKSLVSKVNAKFPEKQRFARFTDFVNFFKEYEANVLVILDDVYNDELLQYFRQTFPEVPCIAVTRDPVVMTSPTYQRVPLVRQVVRVSELGDEEVLDLLTNTYELTTNFTGKQVQSLVQRCCGLPLVANLLASALKEGQQETYQAYMASNVGSLKLGGPHGSVVELFEFSLSHLSEKLQQLYYAFLLYDANEPVNAFDLSILWGYDPLNRIATERMCQLLAEKSLLRRADDETWFIHQILHEAATKHAARTYKLDARNAIANIRLRIITGRLNPKKSEEFKYSPKRLITAVKHHRLFLLSKVIEKIDASDLAELCRQKSRDTNFMTFLHYLYTVNWAVAKNSFFGASISYRLIREIIFKLREFHIDYASLVDADRDNGNGKPKSLLHHVFGDRDKWRYAPDRRSLIEMLGQSMEKLHEERKWEEAFCLNDAYRTFLDTLYDEGDLDAFFNSYDGKALNKYDQGELATCAARKGNIVAMKKLIDRFPGVDKHANRSGQTPVMFAAANNHFQVVHLLVDRFADVALAEDRNGWSAVFHATYHGNLEVVDYLLPRTPNAKIEQLTLIAANNGFLELVEYFYDKKPSVARYQDEISGLSAMMAAARCGHFAIVEYIHLVYPESVNSRDAYNWSPLMYAASGGHIDSVEFLYHADGGSSIDVKDNSGLTPLMVAARYGHLDVVVFVFQKKPSITAAKDNDGRTAMMHAAASGHHSVVKEMSHLAAQKPTTPRQQPRARTTVSALQSSMYLLDEIPEGPTRGAPLLSTMGSL